jgi:hypothetical protein
VRGSRQENAGGRGSATAKSATAATTPSALLSSRTSTPLLCCAHPHTTKLPLCGCLAGCRKLAYNRELAASINSGLQKMNDAKTDIGLMKVAVGWVGWVGIAAALRWAALHCTAPLAGPDSMAAISPCIAKCAWQSHAPLRAACLPAPVWPHLPPPALARHVLPCPPCLPYLPCPQIELAVKNQQLACLTLTITTCPSLPLLALSADRAGGEESGAGCCHAGG